jgi:hypothetical protein
MASITSWIRLEPIGRDPDLSPGIEARLHDPLWLLARQWQLGELDGEDGGSAVIARARYQLGHLAGYRPAGGAEVAFDPAETPLAAIVEANRRDAPRPVPDLRTRARAGRQLARVLGAAPAARFAAAFPLALTPDQRAALDDADRRLADAAAGRVADGVAVAAALRASLPALPPPVDVAPAEPAAVAAAAARWLAWYDALAVDAPARAWQPERLEYAFAARADLGGRSLALTAAQHHGGALDGSSVDITDAGPSAAPAVAAVATAVPAPVAYRGMPARRYWDLEDGEVDWSAVDAGPGDLARMLLIDFALVFSDDWLHVPIELPVGALARITSLVVTDTFGVRTAIGPAAQPGWRMYGHGDDAAPILWVQPHAAHLAGPAEDEVVIAPDEQANIAWAIERHAAGADGRARPVVDRPAPPRHGYVIGSHVPDGRHPLRPRPGAGGEPRLARAAIPGAALAPRTALVADLVQLAPDELAAGAIRLRTQHRLVRLPDGRLRLWRATVRDRGPTSLPSIDLRFDRVEGPSR